MKLHWVSLSMVLAIIYHPVVAEDKGMGGKATLAFNAAESRLARRVMITVDKPAGTIVEPLKFAAPQVNTPGVNAGAAALGSLIATLIVKSAHENDEHEANQFSSRIANALSKVDMVGNLTERIQKALDSAGYLRGATFEDVVDKSDLEQPGLLNRIHENEIFTLDSAASFDPNLQSLHIVTTVKLWRKDEFRPVYSVRLHYVSSRVDPAKLAQSPWMKDDGSLLLGYMREGLAETARLFVADLSWRSSQSKIQGVQKVEPWVHLATGSKAPVSVDVVEDKAGRILAKSISEGGEWFSIPKSASAS